jgi:hypothetical protein
MFKYYQVDYVSKGRDDAVPDENQEEQDGKTIKVKPITHKRLKIRAAIDEITLEEAVERALILWLDKRDGAV